MAKLYFYYAAMNAGKSTSLLQASHNYREGGMETYLITAQFDRRAGEGRIASRIGIGEDADTFSPDEDMYQKLQARFAKGRVACVFIDEAQFLDAGIVQVASSLADRGRRVILAGIDSDFRGEPFGPMPQLMAVAEMVDKLHAICVLCGSPASRNQRLIGGKPAPYDSPTIMVGAADSYEARCRACHIVPRPTEGQQQLL